MRRWLLAAVLLWPLLVQAADPEVRVQTRLLPESGVLVGGLLTLQVDLLVDTWFTDAPVMPPLQLTGAVVAPPGGEAQHLNEQQDGRAFFGLRFSYLITPQAAQRYVIPALTFEVQPGQGSGPVKVTSQPLSFTATAPAGAGDGPHLVASKVAFTQQLQRSHEPLRVGDSITRRLRIEAQGAQAMLLPPPVFAEVRGTQRYPQTPQVGPLSDGRGGSLGGVREDSVSYVLKQAGKVQLPAMQLTWWETGTGTSHQASVPAVQFEVIDSPQTTPFSVSDDLRRLTHGTTVRLAEHGLALAFGVLLLVVGGRLLWPFAGRWWLALAGYRNARRLRRLASPEYAWKQALEQINGSPRQLTGLYLWARRTNQSVTLAQFFQRSPNAFSIRLLASLNAGYTRQSSSKTYAAEITQLLHDVQRATTKRTLLSRAQRHDLQSLNPGASR